MDREREKTKTRLLEILNEFNDFSNMNCPIESVRKSKLNDNNDLVCFSNDYNVGLL